MMGNQLNKPDHKQGRRIYLFLLLASVIFLVGLILFPVRNAQNNRATVQIKLVHVENPEAVKSLVISAIKKELDAERLAETLESISSNTQLSSQLFESSDAEHIRNRLMAGALQVDALGETISSEADRESQDLAFAISLTGSGSQDEVAFVEHLAMNIRDALQPDSLKERALEQLAGIQTGIRESEALNSESQKTIETSFEKFVADHDRTFVKAESPKREPPAETYSWELKNLAEQRKKVLQEFEANQTEEFPDKQAVQKVLLRQIQKLDQQIELIKRKTEGEQRLADENGGVRKATFIDTNSGLAKESIPDGLQDLKTDLALAINKMVLVQKSQRETLSSAKALSELLQQRRLQVDVSLTEVQSIHRKNASRLGLLLVASGVISGLIVMRIDSGAFATMFQDEQSVESALQLPVIGQVDLPETTESGSKGLRVANRWVNRSIRFCEILLLAALLLFLVVLWLNSNFSLAWLNDPAQILKSSFS